MSNLNEKKFYNDSDKLRIDGYIDAIKDIQLLYMDKNLPSITFGNIMQLLENYMKKSLNEKENENV